MIKLADAKKGFVLLSKRWVVKRSFAWATRLRRLAKDYERLPDVLQRLHFLVFVTLMLPKTIPRVMATGNAQHALGTSLKCLAEHICVVMRQAQS